jgi:general secretion pathway protein G
MATQQGDHATLTQRRQGRAGGRRAFSLVEIMIVIAIIGLLAGVVTFNVRGYMMKARQSTARAEIATIVQALSAFYTSYGRYPTNEEGLDILTRATDKNPEPLLEGKTSDPWGNPYQYVSPGRSTAFEVVSFGADGREGGEGADADVSSVDLKTSKP